MRSEHAAVLSGLVLSAMGCTVTAEERAQSTKSDEAKQEASPERCANAPEALYEWCMNLNLEEGTVIEYPLEPLDHDCPTGELTQEGFLEIHREQLRRGVIWRKRPARNADAETNWEGVPRLLERPQEPTEHELSHGRSPSPEE